VEIKSFNREGREPEIFTASDREALADVMTLTSIYGKWIAYHCSFT
jgi:hypothetical protein